MVFLIQLFLFSLLQTHLAYSQEPTFIIPSWYEKLLDQKMKSKIEIASTKVKLQEPAVLIKQLNKDQTKLVLFGYNGAVFKDSDSENAQALKINFFAMLEQNKWTMKSSPIW
ncbi:MAG: hypothetical protein KA715_06245 [Xanthomonadaceae bacterium]|nr:hypothetical protein [Xanthomonadaceae bacterium]